MPQEGRFASWFEEKWSGRKDLNLRPPGPEPGALARLRYAPTATRILQTKRELQLNTGNCWCGTAIRTLAAGLAPRMKTRGGFRLPA
jgi:hypothetical protein